MNDNIKGKIPMFIIILILVVFAILFIVNETRLFDDEKTHTFDEAVEKQVGAGTLNMTEKNGRFVEASKKDVEKAMDVNSDKDNLNHMDISEKVSMSEEELNSILKDKGILKNKGQAFLDAQDKYEVNVLYLVSHALVETGNGKSELAKGIEDDGKTYFNFYGIGAFDENAVHTGSSFAKKQKWTSPEKAIMGGARFVRGNYFENNQLSLYQMRWNPKSPGEHQYASDIEWDENIATFMKHYYHQLGIKKDHINKNYYL
ncbi:N-acetylglucosaminidase [Staphylococcus saprophyticus]|uniref:N-acetylglucosaminidase n=1 Tax=Staphylococcus saprophyticus TaxID=29385 RepID=UPI000E072D3F|nr:N-acetylglucosaminidase [Staphylococcus saprophyticus]MDW4260126.1 N-acetylglucosaminidase [Staphylococcus saprophyticus]SUM73674.1 glucosaminidase [Staphylococcus saprophyticus]